MIILSVVVRANSFVTEYASENVWANSYLGLVTRCTTHYFSSFELREQSTLSDYKYIKETHVAVSILCNATRYLKGGNRNYSVLPVCKEASSTAITVAV